MDEKIEKENELQVSREIVTQEPTCGTPKEGKSRHVFWKVIVFKEN